MTRWPPLVWPLMSVASLLILMGLSNWDWTPLALGVTLAVTVFGIAVLLSTRAYDDRRPRPPRFPWIVAGVGAFYLVCAAAASSADRTYGIIAILAGLIPASAVLLLLATMRAKTEPDAGGGLRDPTGAAHDDPAPGIGMDDETPLGDTPEHSDAERTARQESRFERRRSEHAQRRQ